MKSYFLLPLYLLMIAGSLSATGTNHNPAHPPSWPPLQPPCFQPAKLVNTGATFVNRTLADVNDDGLPDLITVPEINPYDDLTTAVSVLLNLGNGHFGTATQVDVGGKAVSVQVADVNGDGKSDLIVIIALIPPAGDDGVSVLLGNGNGSFISPQRYVIGSGPLEVITSIQVTELNGDNRPDLVLTTYYDDPYNPFNNGGNRGKIGVLLNNGNGTFAPFYMETFGNIEVAVADVNNDNRPDLVMTNYKFSNAGRYSPLVYYYSNVSVLLNRGDGTFGDIFTLPISGDAPGKPAVVDVNGDGQLDIVVANLGSDNVSIYAGNGTGSFSSPVNFAVVPSYSRPSLLSVQDVNGDNKPDLIGRCRTYASGIYSEPLWVLLNEGNNRFGPVSLFSLSGPLLALADVNGDGKLDVVAGGTGNNDVSILVGLDNGSFADAVNFATGGIQGGVQITDINQDNKPDMIAFGSGDTVSVLLGCQSDSTRQPCPGKGCIPFQIIRVR